MENRRTIRRVGLRVIHRHRIGHESLRRVSELVFVHGEAKAILEWIDSAGVRTPIYIDIDRAKLRMIRGIRTLYYYDGSTEDPRFVDLTPASSTAPMTK
jgi:hypothetical protein